jgi:hypothetical protein
VKCYRCAHVGDDVALAKTHAWFVTFDEVAVAGVEDIVVDRHLESML